MVLPRSLILILFLALLAVATGAIGWHLWAFASQFGVGGAAPGTMGEGLIRRL